MTKGIMKCTHVYSQHKYSCTETFNCRLVHQVTSGYVIEFINKGIVTRKIVPIDTVRPLGT